MTDVHISPAKQRQVEQDLERLGVREGDLVEKFILGSGPGGQKINKTRSCVYLAHQALGIEIKCQKTRSREANRFFARRELCERIKAQVQGEKTRRQQEAEKIRRKKRRRSRRQKERMLEEKRKVSEKKKLRQPVRPGTQEGS